MEGLAEQIDIYCERTDFTYWAEPLNALSNGAFLIAALVMWARLRPAPVPGGRPLCLILFAIGIGSYLWHTHATAWAVALDSGSIAVFILTYLYLANRAFWGWPVRAAALGTAAFLPYAAATVPVFQALPFFTVSAGYWPVALLIALYGVALARRAPATARGLWIGAGLLTLSLTFRSVDEPLCASLPMGTHFLWHLLNGVMLGWMIEVYARHRRAAS
jgi:hypothetical protein